MTLLRSALLKREGFGHGFGTKLSMPGEYPDKVHVLLQVHGERIVVLGRYPVPSTRYPVKDLDLISDPSVQPAAEFRAGDHQQESSGILNLESGIAGNNLDIKYRGLPASPFRFDEGDAMVSNLPGVSVGIRTADCLPVLIVDRVKGAAAAVHCGWRSLALELAGKAVRVMCDIMGSRERNLLAAIGPSIGPCCYEVGREVKDAFSHFRSGDGLFLQRDKSLFLDLASGVKTQLIREGMTPENVDEIVGCTSCNPDLFWSHRARREDGRMVSFITVREPYV